MLRGLVIFLIVALCSCRNADLQKMHKYAVAGNHLKAAETAEKLSSKPGKDQLLWKLEAGGHLRPLKKFSESTQRLDEAENLMKLRYNESLASSSADQIGAVLVNDTMLDYPAFEYEAIMGNTYKALNFMALENWPEARVEFNRTIDRQRRAVERFQKEITELKKAAESKQASMYGAEHYDAKSGEAKVMKAFKRETPEFNQWSAYPDFVNPFATFAAGVFLLHLGDDLSDRNNADTYLRRTIGMSPDCLALKDMLSEVRSGKKTDGLIDIIFENGLGASRKEFRVNLPIFLFDSDARVITSGIAFPQLKFHPAAVSRLSISSDRKKFYTEKVADIDAVIQTEYKKRLPSILTRATLSAVWKTAAQYQLREKAKKQRKEGKNGNGYDIGAITMALYQSVTNRADLRCWASLPKNFQTTRVPRPDNGRLVISDDRGQQLAIIDVPSCKKGILYLKKTSRTSPLKWHFITTKK